LVSRFLPLPDALPPLLDELGAGPMATCDVCGDDYDKTMRISVAGQTHTFGLL